jgi:ABC-2 type transport system permease protein
MSAALTLWRRHMTKLKGSPEEAFGILIQPILWVVLFGAGMKGIMGATMLGGEDAYIAFMAPGIVALTALSGAVVGGSVWLDERTRGIVKEYLVAPVPRVSILLGNVLSVMTKSLFQAIIILLVGVLMGAQLALNPVGWLGGLLLVAGFALFFAGIALAVASKVNDTGAYHMLIFLFNLPLLFMSNALYPLSAMPTWMEVGARINPTSYVVDGMRRMVIEDGANLSGDEALPLWLCFTVVWAFAALGLGFGYSAFKKSIK